MTSKIPVTAVSDHGVFLITPSDKDFGVQVSSLVRGKDSRAKTLIQSASPFCVFVRNTNKEEIVGISLQWKILRADGTNITKGVSQSSPGFLTGLIPADPAMVGLTSLVNANSTSFFSLNSETKMLVEAMTASFGSNLTKGQNQEIESRISQSRTQRNELLGAGDTVVVSIDSLILSDGTFLGPDNNQLIVNIKALVQAKRDLGEAINRQAKKHEDPNKVFETVEALAKDPSQLRKFGPQEIQFQRAYLNYLRVSLDEIIGIRDARGSAAAIKYYQDAFHRPWPSLHPINSQ